LLLKITEAILVYLKQPEPDWKKQWKLKAYTSPLMQRQRDGWSCGLFVFMAIKALIQREPFESVQDDRRSEIQEMVLQDLLKIP
jgi:hypothetical protein